MAGIQSKLYYASESDEALRERIKELYRPKILVDDARNEVSWELRKALCSHCHSFPVCMSVPWPRLEEKSEPLHSRATVPAVLRDRFTPGAQRSKKLCHDSSTWP